MKLNRSFSIIPKLLFVSVLSFGQKKNEIDTLKNNYFSWQSEAEKKITDIYPFTLVDYSPKLYTMRQFNEGYLSFYRITSDITYKHTTKKYQYLILPIQMLASLYLIPLTHEEGHRSVLTNLGIGSISAPLFKKGVAKVTGVTDLTLKTLRDTDLPYYIRLHTAGIESDYALSKREQQLVMFDQEKIRNVIGDFFVRRLGVVLYYTFSASRYNNTTEAEEANELERDIVGDDVRGAVRHLHRPTSTFYRYTNYGDLLPDERRYLRNIGLWSLVNLANPLLFGKSNFIINNTLKAGFGIGYIMVPFGTMTEENIWLKYKHNGNLAICVRQYNNKNNTYWAIGLSLFDLPFSKHYAMSAIVQGWKQPEKLSFTTNKGIVGGAANFRFSYRIFGRESSPLKWLSVDGDIRVKTEGFIPEDPSLKEAFNVAIGFSFCPK
ncbi:hypothetical protein WBJ53_25730 [Spirosoma sp. SC4-14]|uniref:hypothetical protein n=1 Tax=Spirosoma sp. SC4-14 TaxID=3128900 RepID=UPI0030CFF865